MRANVRVVAAAAVFSSATCAAQAQQAVQWKVSDGGNGHWYQFETGFSGLWNQARSAAQVRGGQLACVGGSAEQDFLESLASSQSIVGDFWLGGFQVPNSQEPAGGWSWIDGSAWTFDNWGAVSSGTGAPPSPNDWPTPAPGEEDFLEICFRPAQVSPAGGWDDQGQSPNPYIIEWSADCNNDGIVDYGQILSGQLVDANSNGVPDTCELGPCAGDVIPDGVINGVDLAAVLSAWGTTGQGQFPADANRDGIVNGTDLSYVLSGWGTCVTVPTWATLLEAAPDPAIVTSPTLRAAIAATGLPWRVRDTATQIEFVLIPPGSFQMGCTASNMYGCEADENPAHQVTLTQPFYMGRYEVTQAQWQARMGSNPSLHKNASPQVPADQVPNRPVESVSWNTIQGFLSVTGMRLPTEAEWEYAYRAGTNTAFHSMPGYPDGTNDDALVPNIAWINSNSGSQTRPVGQKAGNGFGLHDMSGNVWEWLNDWYSPTYYQSSPATNPSGPSTGSDRVMRGGRWFNDSLYCRSADRDRIWPSYSDGAGGFRVARNP